MANMSYCRFRNTRGALSDCIYALDPCENEYEISSEEVCAGKAMFRDFLRYCESEGIIEGYEDDRITEVFEEHNVAVNECEEEGKK